MQDNQDLNFKKINLGFAPVFASWRKDALLARQVGWAIDCKKWSINDEKKWILKMINDKRSHFWACLLGDKVIGRVGIYNIDLIKKTGEVSIFIGQKAYRGKGYGKKMLKFVLEKGYKYLLLKDIYATIFDDNYGAAGFFEKNGFKKSGKTDTMNFLGEKRKFYYFDHIKTN